MDLEQFLIESARRHGNENLFLEEPQEACLQKWIEHMQALEVNDQEAEEAIEALYFWANEPPPEEIVWFDDPELAQLRATEYLELSCDREYTGISYQSATLIRNAIEIRLDAHIGRQWLANLNTKGNTQGSGFLYAAESVSKFLEQSVLHEVVHRLTEQGVSINRQTMLWIPYSAIFANVDSMVDSSNRAARDDINVGVKLARNISFLWLFARCAVVCRKPIVLHVDEGNRPHHPSAPAVVFKRQSENWRCWCWHGTGVPQQIIESPGSIKRDDIDGEKNQELRRVLLERFGVLRYFGEIDWRPTESIPEDYYAF